MSMSQKGWRMQHAVSCVDGFSSVAGMNIFSTLGRRYSDSDGDGGVRLPAREVYFVTEPSLPGQLRSCFRARSLVFFLCQLRGF